MTQPVAPGQGMADFWRAACSEFPNDNPQLHEGAVWVCPAPRSRARAILLAEAQASSAKLGAAGERDTTALAAHNVALSFMDDAAFDAAVWTDDISTNEKPDANTPAETHADQAENIGLEDVAHTGHVDDAAHTGHVDDVANTGDVEDTHAVGMNEAEQATNPSVPELIEESAAELNVEAVEALQWRSQLETQDPFLAELAQLLSSAHDAPLGIFASADNSASDELSAPAAPSREQAALEPLEPLSLEGFIQGESLPLAAALPRVQSLNDLQLQADIESLSSSEQAWDNLVQPLSAFLMARSATHAAIVLPRLLVGDAVSVTRLPRAVQQCLVAEDFASEFDGAVLIRPEFRARARRLHKAFRAGSLEQDALQRFLASVMRALLATPLDSATLLDELRGAGVNFDVRAA